MAVICEERGNFVEEEPSRSLELNILICEMKNSLDRVTSRLKTVKEKVTKFVRLVKVFPKRKRKSFLKK